MPTAPAAPAWQEQLTSPGMAEGTAATGTRPHGCTGIVALWHRATMPEDTCQAVPVPYAWLWQGCRGRESWCLPCQGDKGHPHCWRCQPGWLKGEAKLLHLFFG